MAAGKKSKAGTRVDYTTFIERVIPDVEKQIAQQLFSLGVNMVSVMEHINDRRDIAARAVNSGITDDTNWTDATTSDDGHSLDAVMPIPIGKSNFHIFISYRRTGTATARSVKQALENMGYRCFIDFEALNVGDFQGNLERNLAGTPVIVVIMTPGSMTKDARWPGAGRAPAAGEPAATDWLQREIHLGLQMGKLIIPVRTADLDIEAEFKAVPQDDIGMLARRNIVELSEDYFAASIDKIATCIEQRENDTDYAGDEKACDSAMGTERSSQKGQF